MKTFEPLVNDYVKWPRIGHVVEGWVYYRDQEDEYITIETGVKPKKTCNYVKNVLHCKDHVLVVCHAHLWEQLQYVKSRETNHEDSNIFIRTVTDDRPSSHG